MFNLASEEHLTNVILSFCRYLHISVCVYVCLPQSASISSPLDLSISLLSSVKYHSLLYTYRHSSPLNISAPSPSLLHSTPLTTHFNFFYLTSFQHFSPTSSTFVPFPLLSHPTSCCHSHFHLLVCPCVVYLISELFSP